MFQGIHLHCGNILAENFDSLRKQIYTRYVTFFQNLFTSASKEVRHLARIVSQDPRSTVYKNVIIIQEASGLSPWDFSKARIKDKIQKAPVPPNNDWRMSLLPQFLDFRREKEILMEDTKAITKMIDSLCNSWTLPLLILWVAWEPLLPQEYL